MINFDSVIPQDSILNQIKRLGYIKAQTYPVTMTSQDTSNGLWANYRVPHKTPNEVTNLGFVMCGEYSVAIWVAGSSQMGYINREATNNVSSSWMSKGSVTEYTTYLLIRAEGLRATTAFTDSYCLVFYTS